MVGVVRVLPGHFCCCFCCDPCAFRLEFRARSVVDAIRATVDDTAEDIRELEEDEAMTLQALDLLNSNRNDAYEVALAALRDDMRESWEDVLARDPDGLEEEEPATADAERMRRYLERETLPRYVTRKKELANRPLFCEQAFGEAFDRDKLGWLGRYEVHLDLKLERTLAMLIRLQELRRASSED